jgi:hypothetical protein
MPLCAVCKTEETQLYFNGQPICLKCAEKRTPARPMPPPSREPPRQPDAD